MNKHFITLIFALSFVLSGFTQSLNEANDQVFTIADHPPEFVGGMDSLSRFIRKNLKYPYEAKRKGISGKVYVSFVVGKKGVVRDVKIIRSVHPLLDKEALRITSLLPNWKPGMNDGKPVSVLLNLPINFKLSHGGR